MSTRPRPTYANVMSTLAVFIALAGGGTAVAASVARNSVGSPQIRNDSIVGADVKESRLGTVPRATVADRAANVMRVTVHSLGTVVSSSGRITVAKVGTGYYEMRFPRNVLRCTSVATLGYPEQGAIGSLGLIRTGHHNLDPRIIGVGTNQRDGTAFDLSFELVVVC